MRKMLQLAAAATLLALASTTGAAAENLGQGGLAATGEQALCLSRETAKPPIPFTPALSGRDAAPACRLSDVVLQEMADHLRRAIDGGGKRVAPERLQLG